MCYSSTRSNRNLINPKDDSPIVRYVAEDTKTKLSEMRSMYAQYVEKHGENAKAKALKQKITEAEAKMYESATAEKNENNPTRVCW